MELSTQAIVSMEESPYGYSTVHITDDLTAFEQIAIEKTLSYSCFGIPPAAELLDFFLEIGSNEADSLLYDAVDQIIQISHVVLSVSDRETIWLTLHSFTPTPFYDVPRWHFDGQYYFRTDPQLQYRFAFTLLGPSTLFYPLSYKEQASRRFAWIEMANRSLMADVFRDDAYSPELGDAVFMIGGASRNGALHSEPPIHTKRLFLSIIPCSHKDLLNLNR